jgi:hypothetical protein
MDFNPTCAMHALEEASHTKPVEGVQNFVPQWHAVGLIDKPSVLGQTGIGLFEHLFPLA